MGKLSAHGVKLVLPVLLKASRTARGEPRLLLHFLGNMAHYLPKQLSTLPSVVPKLGEVLSDSHPEVRGAATEALRRLGE